MSVLDFSGYIAERTRDFVGREWVFQTIDDWLGDPDGAQAFLLTAEPGAGKTAVAARLFQFSAGNALPPVGCTHMGQGFLSASHFCRSGGWISPDSFARSLSAQLADRYLAFADALVADPRLRIEQRVGTNLGTVIGAQITNYYAESSEALFNDLVRSPLQTLCQGNGSSPLVIMVDGLDEALAYSGPLGIVSLVAKARDLPSEVRLILTSRRDERVVNEFFGADGFFLSGSEFDSRNNADVTRYANARLGQPDLAAQAATLNQAQRTELISQIGRQAAGNFLYVRFLVDAVADGRRDLSDLEGLPAGLDSLYYDSLDRVVKLGEAQWRGDYAPLIGILCVARQSLTLSQLAQFTGRGQDALWQSLVDLGQFVEEVIPEDEDGDAEPQYRVYHQSVADFVRRRHFQRDRRRFSNKYCLSAEESHRQIVDHYRGEATTWEEVDWSQVDGYGLRHLPVHLFEAGQAETLSALLSEIGFLECKTAHFGVYAALDDLRFGITALTNRPQMRQPLIRWLQVLDREAHSLRDWSVEQAPALFAQQLHNRAVELGVSDLAESAAGRLARIGQPYLALRFRIPNESSALLRVLSGHGSPLSYVLATPDGAYALAGSRETLKIWNVETGQELMVLDGTWRAIGFAEGSKQAVLSHNGSLVVWDLRDNRAAAVVESVGDWAEGLAVTSDGRRVLCLSADHRLRLVDLETGDVVHHFDGPGRPIERIVLTPDDRMALTATQMDALSQEEKESCALQVWDLEAGHELPAFPVPAWIGKLAVTPDGRSLIASYGPQGIRMWDLETREETVPYETRAASAFAVSPEGRCIVYAHTDAPYELRIVDRRAGREVGALAAHPYPSNDLTITANGRYLVSCCGTGEVKVWDWQAVEATLGEVYKADQGANVWLRGLTPDGRCALFTSRENALHVRDLESGRPVCAPLEGHAGIVRGVSFTSDSSYAVSASDDRTLKVWDLVAGNQVQEFPGHGFYGCVAVLPGDQHVLSISLDKELIVRDLKSGRVVSTALAFDDYPDAIALTSDGRRVLVAVNDAIVVWDLRDQELVHTFHVAHSAILELVITPDDRLAFSMGYDSPVIGRYDLVEAKKLPALAGHGEWARTIAATSDGRHAISCANDGKLIVWDLQTGESVRHLLGHTDWVYDMALTADDRRVFSASQDGTVRAWDWRAGEPVASTLLGGVLDRLRVAPDGRRVVVEERSGIIYCLDYVEPDGSTAEETDA